MNHIDLRKLIDLHDAYDKHVPLLTSSSFGAYYTRTVICQSCLAPLNQPTPESSPKVLHKDAGLAVVSIATQWPAVWRMFKEQAKVRELTQAYADLLISTTCILNMQDLWTTIRQLCIPSEDMLAEYLDTNATQALAAAIAIPALRPRAYQAVLKCTDIKDKLNYCRTILGHTDKAMMASAEAVASGHECYNVGSDFETFKAWHDRQLMWNSKEAT